MTAKEKLAQMREAADTVRSSRFARVTLPMVIVVLHASFLYLAYTAALIFYLAIAASEVDVTAPVEASGVAGRAVMLGVGALWTFIAALCWSIASECIVVWWLSRGHDQTVDVSSQVG